MCWMYMILAFGTGAAGTALLMHSTIEKLRRVSEEHERAQRQDPEV